METKDTFYMQKALEEAQRAYEQDEIPVGAVVVCGDRIIARGHNLTETLNDVTAHAEMQAITAAANYLGGKYLTECTLYVTLEPCAMCAGAIGWAQVRRLVYGAMDEKKGYHLLAPDALHPKTEVTGGIEADKAEKLLKDFFRKKRLTNNHGTL
ncbi:MAG: nucleoside deaminase [Paraprevotella sp.]|nr:nucleoside deaminase [Paraprevotella sp.]